MSIKSLVFVNENDFNSRLKLNNEKLILVDFYADWCEPCKWLDEILEAIKSDISAKADIIKVDIEKCNTLARELEIRSVPVLMLYQNGKCVWRINGFLSAEDLITKILSFQV